MSFNKRRQKALQSCGKSFSAELKNRATPAEIRFKEILDKYKIRYFFQHPFQRGEKLYILDFYLPDYATVVEIDGGYHDSVEQSKLDAIRTAEILKKERFARVVRVRNEQVFMPEKDLLQWLAKQFCPWL